MECDYAGDAAGVMAHMLWHLRLGVMKGKDWLRANFVPSQNLLSVVYKGSV
jgi:hypothetical protein